jgi:hypothetical protein
VGDEEYCDWPETLTPGMRSRARTKAAPNLAAMFFMVFFSDQSQRIVP